MTKPDLPSSPEPPGEARQRRAWRRWLTVGELVGLGALLVAGLGYIDAHRDRMAARADRVAAARRAGDAQAAAHALVLRGEAQDGGARVRLSPVDAGQVVQSQRYLFPQALLDHAMEVDAAQPQIDRAWLPAAAVRLLAARAKGEGGEGRIVVGVLTRYVEDGEALSDRSLYQVGYRTEPAGLFGGERLVLQGVSLRRRGVAGDLARAVEQAAASE